jgi:hypothetical protein
VGRGRQRQIGDVESHRSRNHRAAKRAIGLADDAPIPKGARLPVSENAKKARAKLARLPARIANLRQDVLPKLTSDLTRAGC